jgi:hypothetical protein
METVVGWIHRSHRCERMAAWTHRLLYLSAQLVAQCHIRTTHQSTESPSVLNLGKSFLSAPYWRSWKAIGLVLGTFFIEGRALGLALRVGNPDGNGAELGSISRMYVC